MALTINVDGKNLKYMGEVTASYMIKNPGKLEVNSVYTIIFNTENVESLTDSFDSESIYNEKLSFVYLGEPSESEEEHINEIEYMSDLDDACKGIYVWGEDLLITVEESIEVDLDEVSRATLDDSEIIQLMVDTKPDTDKLKNIRKQSSQKDDNKLLRYDISEEDSILVMTVKEYINDNHIYESDIYDKLETGDAWNLVYGLRKRHAMTWEYFEKWMNVLGTEIDVTITKK